MRISTILDQIDLGSIALPKFQRGYVWNREQVRSLMYSLYRKHPVGSLLTWITPAETAQARGDGSLPPGSVKLLLDGQQRITSLYGIVRGKPPLFFDGNEQAFTGLYFNIEDETFEFYAPVKMKDNPLWINVTKLMKMGAGRTIMQLIENQDLSEKLKTYAHRLDRLNAIDQIKDIDLHIDEVTGEDKTVDVVVDIFNRVNSGGTKLSSGDLALAKISAGWPAAREAMKACLNKWRNAGYSFQLDWLLRCVNAVLTGKAPFSALRSTRIQTFQQGLQQTEKLVDTLLNLISARLGLDHDRVLGSRYSIPLLARYMAQCGGHLLNHNERDKFLYWYVHTFLWGRYAGSTETTLNRDLTLIEEIEGASDRLISELQQSRVDLRLQPSDFAGWSQGARFYPLLYMMTRVGKATDWDTGVKLSNHLLGYMNRLELHHIFPKSLLYEHGYERSEANAIANFTFLTKETNLLVFNRDPAEYLEDFINKNPGAVESHWIPMDSSLWKIENYRKFLAARRELLANAANNFLDSLLTGVVPETEVPIPVLEREEIVVPGEVQSEEEERKLQEISEWVVQQGLPEGEYLYELTDTTTGEVMAIIDLAWPDGLQEGYSQPVALLLDEDRETIQVVNQAGYKYFTNTEAFRTYVQSDILAMAEIGQKQIREGKDERATGY